MPRLVLLYPEKKKRWEVSVPDARFEIGRSRDAQVCIPHASVSKRHVLVECKPGGRVTYQDLGSRNGVSLNGIRLDRGELEDRDELRVGSIHITFYRDQAPPPPATATETAAVTSVAQVEALLGSEGALNASHTLELLPETLADLQRAERPAIVPPRARARGPRSPSQAFLLVGLVLSVALGISLGYLGGGAEGPPPVPATPGKDALAPATTPTPARMSPLGGPASSADSETRHRLAVRLCLDFWKRPPLGRELARLAAFSPEELWLEVQAMAPSRPEPTLEQLQEAFKTLLARPPDPQEHGELLEKAQKDPAHYLFAVGTSSQYAQSTHRRRRSAETLARSLLVDLTGDLPSSAHTAEIRETLKAGPGMIVTLARTLLQTSNANSLAPGAAQAIPAWLQDVYARMLLRFPTTAETEANLKTLAASPDAWRTILIDLVSREEYLSY